MITINRNPSRRELMIFGVLPALLLLIIGALVWWRAGAPVIAAVLWALGVAISAAFYLVPALRRPLYLGWMYAAYPIGWTVSHVLVGLIFYLVITPVGLALRLLGRDAMGRRGDPAARSYWVEHHPESDPARYFRQF